MLAVEIFLERKDHEHLIDVAGYLLDASAAPGPQLRRDVVDDADSQCLAAPGQAQIEIGIVHEHHRVGALAPDRLYQLLEDPSEGWQMPEHVEQPDDSHLPGVMQHAHSLPRQQIPSDAERFQMGVEAFQMANHFGGVQIAGGLAGDDGQLHGRPPAIGCSVA